MIKNRVKAQRLPSSRDGLGTWRFAGPCPRQLIVKPLHALFIGGSPSQFGGTSPPATRCGRTRPFREPRALFRKQERFSLPHRFHGKTASCSIRRGISSNLQSWLVPAMLRKQELR